MQVCFTEKSTSKPMILNGVIDFGRMKHKIEGKYKEIYYVAYYNDHQERETALIYVSEFAFTYAQEKETENGIDLKGASTKAKIIE